MIESLNDGKNIILSGKFGIGRTSLIKEIAKSQDKERKFIFVDFGQTPLKMSENIIKESGILKRLKNQENKMGYKALRYRIANAKLSKKRMPIIVFDNIAKVTAQKTMFLRHLILEQNFQFIAIVEHFLPWKDLFDLKALFMPYTDLTLHNLKTNDVEILLRHYYKQYQVDRTENYVHNMARLSDGYPLVLAEMLKINPRKQKK